MSWLRQHKLRAAGAGAVIILLLGLVGIGLANRAGAAATGAPAYQTGEVHSCTTNGRADVTTLNGGITWFYGGNGPFYPVLQDGVVHSFYTGGNADVATANGGSTWDFEKEGFLFCSPP